MGATMPEKLDSHAALAAGMRGKILTIPKAVMTMCRDMGWPGQEPQQECWTESQWVVYHRLRRDTEAILDVYILFDVPIALMVD